MPRIVKWDEKRTCVKISPKPVKMVCESDDGVLSYVTIPTNTKLLKIPEQFYGVFQDLPQSYSEYTSENKKTLFDLIEEIIRDTMTSNLSDDTFFKDFVEIKEVPKWEI